MNLKSGIYYDDEIDFSSFIYSEEDIQRFADQANKIENYFKLPITEENFSAVCNIWYDLISRIPLPSALIREKFILRSRPSDEFKIFDDEADISYNSKCPELIMPGRFNRPEEAVFYGTLPSDRQEKFVNAATIESFKELISEGNTADVLYYHLCKFNVKQPFPVLNLCFEPQVISLHPGLNKIVVSQIENLTTNLPKESADSIIRFWHYVSKISSTRKLCDQHYMVSTALFCAIREYYNSMGKEVVNGIIYPSPMVYGDAVNIALMPGAVDLNLSADDCFIFKYVRGIENKKYFETDICSMPTKVSNGKLNIGEVVWGRQLGNFGV